MEFTGDRWGTSNAENVPFDEVIIHKLVDYERTSTVSKLKFTTPHWSQTLSGKVTSHQPNQHSSSSYWVTRSRRLTKDDMKYYVNKYWSHLTEFNYYIIHTNDNPQTAGNACMSSPLCDYWCLGAKVPGHQYPLCWLNIHYIEPVSNNNTAFMFNKSENKITFLYKE